MHCCCRSITCNSSHTAPINIRSQGIKRWCINYSRRLHCDKPTSNTIWTTMDRLSVGGDKVLCSHPHHAFYSLRGGWTLLLASIYYHKTPEGYWSGWSRTQLKICDAKEYLQRKSAFVGNILVREPSDT